MLFSDEGTLFISVAVASIRSCAQASMMAVAICWVNLGIHQWRHLLCNCVIFFITATALCRIICSKAVAPYFEPPKRNKYGESITGGRSASPFLSYLRIASPLSLRRCGTSYSTDVSCSLQLNKEKTPPLVKFQYLYHGKMFLNFNIYITVKHASIKTPRNSTIPAIITSSYHGCPSFSIGYKLHDHHQNEYK